ncbi:MAG TPA: ABC transporter permease [Anaerolineae bacterium]|nr:ABC transporter permease [Anaerolineae bacterium]
MRNIGIVIKHEIISTITKPSFWVTTLVLPALIMAFTFGSQFFSMQMLEEEMDPTEFIQTETTTPAIGYVDHAGIITELPAEYPPDRIRAFPDEAAAQAALDAGELQSYYVVAADFMETGALVAVEPEFAPLSNLAGPSTFQYILNYNLIDDPALAARADNPVAALHTTALAKTTSSGEDYTTRFMVGYGVLFIFFFVLTMSSSFLLRSVSREKENRTVEVLLVSVRPRELMLGKIVGLGVVALAQMAIWGGGSLLTMTRGSALLSTFGVLLDTVSFPPGFFVWAILYFLLGYLLYAAVFSAIGALAPTARESGQFTFMAMLPLMLPMWFNTLFVQTPHSLLSVIFSLFPLTAPTAMLPRLVTGGVPTWQPLVGVALLAAATYLFVLLAARFFRADTLLSTDSLNWNRLVVEFKRGKV